MSEHLKTYIACLRGLLQDRRAVTALEYGMIAALISVVIIASVALIGTNLKTKFGSIATAIGTAAPP